MRIATFDRLSRIDVENEKKWNRKMSFTKTLIFDRWTFLYGTVGYRRAVLWGEPAPHVTLSTFIPKSMTNMHNNIHAAK